MQNEASGEGPYRHQSYKHRPLDLHTVDLVLKKRKDPWHPSQIDLRKKFKITLPGKLVDRSDDENWAKEKFEIYNDILTSPEEFAKKGPCYGPQAEIYLAYGGRALVTKTTHDENFPRAKIPKTRTRKTVPHSKAEKIQKKKQSKIPPSPNVEVRQKGEKSTSHQQKKTYTWVKIPVQLLNKSQQNHNAC